MPAKDFSRVEGTRLRITMTRYQPKSRTFTAIPNSTALITVASEKDIQGLWSQVEAVIGRVSRGAKRDAGAARTGDSDSATAAAV